MRTVFCVLGVGLLLLVLPGVHAATIEGTVFDGLTLEPLPGTVVTVDTIPQQTKVATNGNYSFEVPEGSYEITATYSERGVVILQAEREITIENGGTFNVDLILLPEIGDLPDTPFPDDNPPTVWEQLLNGPLVVWGLLVVVLVVIGYAMYTVHFRTHSVLPNSSEALKEEKKEEARLDKYAEEVVLLLKRGGHRMTQKELREKVNVGEAKVSLIVSELEEYGLIKKIKKGRGNILILTEKGREFKIEETDDSTV